MTATTLAMIVVVMTATTIVVAGAVVDSPSTEGAKTGHTFIENGLALHT